MGVTLLLFSSVNNLLLRGLELDLVISWSSTHLQTYRNKLCEKKNIIMLKVPMEDWQKAFAIENGIEINDLKGRVINFFKSIVY